MIIIFNKWIVENDDLYILSLDCMRAMDSYWYYKYCEDEWELFDIFEIVSEDMRKYLDDNCNLFTNQKNYEYSDIFDKHCDEIIEHCQNALVRFRQDISQNHSDILVNFCNYNKEKARKKICEKLAFNHFYIIK